MRLPVSKHFPGRNTARNEIPRSPAPRSGPPATNAAPASAASHPTPATPFRSLLRLRPAPARRWHRAKETSNRSQCPMRHRTPAPYVCRRWTSRRHRCRWRWRWRSSKPAARRPWPRPNTSSRKSGSDWRTHCSCNVRSPRHPDRQGRGGGIAGVIGVDADREPRRSRIQAEPQSHGIQVDSRTGKEGLGDGEAAVRSRVQMRRLALI